MRDALFSLTIFLSAFLLFQIQPLIGKVHSSLVRRHSRRLDDVHARLSNAALRRLRLCSSDDQAGSRPNPGHASLGVVNRGDLRPADCSEAHLEARWRRRADLADHRAFGRDGGPSLFCALVHGSVAPGLVQPRARGALVRIDSYALSNVGSLLRIVSFPVVFEWALPAKTLAYLWSGSFILFAILCVTCTGWSSPGRAAQPIELPHPLPAAESKPMPSVKPAWQTKLLWFALAMVPSVLLLATTNQVCLDVASVPFLWVLPLTLYLLSFILCFDSDWWYSRKLMMPAAVLSAGRAFIPCFVPARAFPSPMQLLAYFAAVFPVCDGLSRRARAAESRRPSHLTVFYLVIAAAGAGRGDLRRRHRSPAIWRLLRAASGPVGVDGAIMLMTLGTDRQSRFYGCKPRTVWLVFFTALSGFGVMLAGGGPEG